MSVRISTFLQPRDFPRNFHLYLKSCSQISLTFADFLHIHQELSSHHPAFQLIATLNPNCSSCFTVPNLSLPAFLETDDQDWLLCIEFQDTRLESRNRSFTSAGYLVISLPRFTKNRSMPDESLILYAPSWPGPAGYSGPVGRRYPRRFFPSGSERIYE